LRSFCRTVPFIDPSDPSPRKPGGVRKARRVRRPCWILWPPTLSSGPRPRGAAKVFFCPTASPLCQRLLRSFVLQGLGKENTSFSPPSPDPSTIFFYFSSPTYLCGSFPQVIPACTTLLLDVGSLDFSFNLFFPLPPCHSSLFPSKQLQKQSLRVFPLLYSSLYFPRLECGPYRFSAFKAPVRYPAC